MRQEDFLDKPLPSSQEAETVLLGSVLLDNECIVPIVEQLCEDDFYDPRYRYIFRSMARLHQDSKIIDPITIGEDMKANGLDPSRIGGVASFMGLCSGVPHMSANSITEFVMVVKKHSISRVLLRYCNDVSSSILSGTEDVSEVLEDAEAHILQISTRLHSESKVESKAFYSLAEIVPDLHEQFDRYHRGEIVGVKTGMPEVDDLLDGGALQPGGIYLIGAGEKTGKTSLALDWAYNIAAVQGFHVPIVTLEMAKLNMAKRLYSAHMGISYGTFRPGMFDSTYNKAIEGLEGFGKLPISIADKLFSFEQIARHLRRVVEHGYKTGVPVGAIILDYLQLLSIAIATGNRTDEVTKISRAIKMLASELELPMIVISNLNRTGLTEGQEPDTFNLRDSGSLAFDAEAIFFLHNPKYHPGKPYEPQEVTDMNLILSRQRNGPTGRIPVKLIGPYMQFMTETQFRTHFGDTANDNKLPRSSGEKLQAEKALASGWDDDDDDWMTP